MSHWTPPQFVGYRESAPDRNVSTTDVFQRLDLPVVEVFPTNAWVLVEKQTGSPRQVSSLELARPDGVRLSIDFAAGKARHRSHEAGKGIQPLARALGIPAFRRKHGRLPDIVDCTGGLGQDAWALASLGCRVTVIERHPLLHTLLENALARARVATESITRDTADRVTLLQADAREQLPQRVAHAIYLDPMYPERTRKKADSRKGMQFLHALLGPPGTDEGSGLLPIALASDASRIVVKRPKGAEPLAGASHWRGQRTAIESANTRYDVYHLHTVDRDSDS